MKDVKTECTECFKSAHGPDGLEPAEMALFSDLLFARIAELLNLIESGSPWPAGIPTARTAFLEKGPH